MKVSVLTGPERRRRWRYEDKLRIVEESFEPSTTVCEVARRHGIAQSLLFTWRRQAREGRLGGRYGAPVLVPVRIADDSVGPQQHGHALGLMEIELTNGRRPRVGPDVDADALRRVLDMLEAR